jgi:hypothetical protein
MKWSESEICLIKTLYRNATRDEILLALNRSWESIKLKANGFGLKRDRISQKQSDLSVLLLDDPTSYYWIGFLAADGHFYSKRVVLGISVKDLEHLRKFGRFISCDNVNIRSNRRSCYVSCMDVNIIPELRRKFGICNRKTSNPLTFDFPDDMLFMAYFIGFIDGDGSIGGTGNRRSISVKVHKNWLNRLRSYEKRVYDICGIPQTSVARVNKRGYTLMNISSPEVLAKIKKFGLRLQLPMMDRKWSRINENKTYQSQSVRERIQYISEHQGLSVADLSRRLGLKYLTLYMFMQRHGLRRAIESLR